MNNSDDRDRQLAPHDHSKCPAEAQKLSDAISKITDESVSRVLTALTDSLKATGRINSMDTMELLTAMKECTDVYIKSVMRNFDARQQKALEKEKEKIIASMFNADKDKPNGIDIPIDFK